MALSRLGQIAMTVSDVNRSVAFYRDKLGLPFLFEAPPRLAFFNLGGVRLMLSGTDEALTTGASVLYFSVDDLRGEYERLLRDGVPFEGEPRLIAKLPDREVWMAFFRDPDRNLLALMSEPRTAA